MRHITLTCRNHPDLRWCCKSIAFTPGHGYNGSRNIFFHGLKNLFEGEHPDAPVTECKCEGKYLVLAPEDPWALKSDKELRELISKD